MSRSLSDVLRIMRLAIARRNENDPDSNDDTLVQYINDFYSLTMSDDVKLFENFGTLKFTIDETNTTGVYTFTEDALNSNGSFVNLSMDAFITLTNPPAGSISWNRLYIYQDPGRFFDYWGINNEDILIPGYPTEMLYYGTEFTFRTIPNTSYDVKIFAYKQNQDFDSDGDPDLPFDYWLRYIAYGAAINYARDYKYEERQKAQIQADFNHEKKLLLTRTHNQVKMARAIPRF